MFKYQKDNIKTIKNQLAYESMLKEVTNKNNKKVDKIIIYLSISCSILFLLIFIIILAGGNI